MSNKFWINWVEGTEGGSHHRHGTLEAARQEAERLARMPGIKGHKVHVLEMKCYCVMPEAPLEWHEEYSLGG